MLKRAIRRVVIALYSGAFAVADAMFQLADRLSGAKPPVVTGHIPTFEPKYGGLASIAYVSDKIASESGFHPVYTTEVDAVALEAMWNELAPKSSKITCAAIPVPMPPGALMARLSSMEWESPHPKASHPAMSFEFEYLFENDEDAVLFKMKSPGIR